MSGLPLLASSSNWMLRTFVWELKLFQPLEIDFKAIKSGKDGLDEKFKVNMYKTISLLYLLDD